MTYVSFTTIDVAQPIFVLDGYTVYVQFEREIAAIKLGPDYGFRLPALAFINSYFGATHIINTEH